MTSRRVGLVVGAALAALLSLAPGAGAASIGVSGGELQWFSSVTEGRPHVVDVDFAQPIFFGSPEYVVTTTTADSTTVNSGCSLSSSNGQTSVFSCTAAGVNRITIFTWTGNDTITTDANDSDCSFFCFPDGSVSQPMTVFARAGADTIRTGAGADSINGEGGNDTILPRGGADTINGGADADTLQFLDRSSVTATLNNFVPSGGDSGDTGSGIENLTGSNGPDTLTGDQHANTLSGAGGGDTIDGRDGNDTVNGDDGDDVLRGGGGGTDGLNGGGGSDTADYSTETGPVNVNLGSFGSDGSVANPTHRDNVNTADVERVRGTEAADALTGNSSANTLIGGPGADTLDGAGGVDLVSYEGRADAVNVTLNATGGDDGGDADGPVGARDTVVNTEQARGGDGADRLTGDGGVNQLFGGAGDDTVTGKAGADLLRGEGDRDTVDYSDRAASERVEVSLDNAVNDGEPGENDDIGDTFERARGGSANDKLTATVAGSELLGGNGNDELFAPNGGGTLAGGRGNDSLTGGDGVDDMFGDEDEDTIEARDGVDDRVDCGDGFDTAFTDGADTRTSCEQGATDADRDGFSSGQDCDDGNPGVRPNAPELPGNDVDENCDGVKSQEVDRDGDGFTVSLDCDDGNAAIRPNAAEIPGNAADENCDKKVAPFTLPANLKVPVSWNRFVGHTQLTKLQVQGVPAGGKVSLTCKKKSGRGKGPGCPFSTKSIKVTRGKANGLGAVRKAKLRTGAVLQIKVTSPGSLALIRSYEFRNAKNPKISDRCQAPGKRTTQRCS